LCWFRNKAQFLSLKGLRLSERSLLDTNFHLVEWQTPP
jgi:hypothetical protein